MNDPLVSPDREIRLGEQTFLLRGSFEVLKALQHAFQQDLLLLQARILEMRQDEIARLIALASGAKENEVGQLLLDEMDVAGADYLMLKAELLAWLALAMTPKRDREKKAQALTHMLSELTNPVSPGLSIKSSVSASSVGHRKRSGKATSGK